MSVPVPMRATREEDHDELAVMLTGGGARAAYQVGLLKGIATHFPQVRFRIVTGVSAGAINAMYLAARVGPFAQKVADLDELWCQLECSSIYSFDWKTLLPFRYAIETAILRRKRVTLRPHALVDTTPLMELLCKVLGTTPGAPISGVETNLRSGDLAAVALMTLDYNTGQTVRWVQGRAFDVFEGTHRRAELTRFTVDHVVASAAIPFVFPAIRIGNSWHGDGGIRLAAPLSPAVHLGARRIIAMSTGHQRATEPAEPSRMTAYPPAAQVLGQLVNAIFLDAIDEDVARMERMNALLQTMRPEDRGGLRPIDLLVLRPSADLGKIAAEYEEYLPGKMKLLLRALGVKEADSPDIASLLMFEPHYTRRIIDLGEADVVARLPEIAEFLGLDGTESSVAV